MLFFGANGQNFNPKFLELPENLNSDDFSFLKKELHDAKVVMLGEATHFDGNVFEIKTKMIQYLYKELGYTTIAFESGFYDVWKAQQNITKGENTKTTLEKSLFPIWSKTNEFQNFITFFDQNKSKLKIIGFDNQITGEYGEKELVGDLYDYCQRNLLPLKLNKDDFELLLESINNSGVFDESDITYEKYKSSLSKLLTNIEKKPKDEIHFYWSQIIKNLLSIAEDSYIAKEPIVSSFNTTSDDNIRDKQMAENLLAYIKMHPNEKIICWGANAHFVNDMTSVKSPIIKEFVPMGYYVKNELKEKVYSFALISASDSIYLNKVWNKTPINTNSFERFLKNQAKPHLFISSKQDEMQKNQLNRLFSPIDFVESRLDLLHDGYFYFNAVKQSTSIINEDEIKVHKSNENLSNSNLERKNVLDKKNQALENEQALNEVLIISYSKKFTYSIIKKAIENINKNYPINPFSSEQFTNIDVKINNETGLNFDFANKQYDRGYNQIDRNAKQLTEVRWNSKGEYTPSNVRNFWSLTYNNPIIYGRFLNIRKSKKFIFKIIESKLINNKEVYVVDFSISRDHFTYTHRSNPSHYSGTLYINKDDFAITKVIENWEYLENSESSKYDIYGWSKKFIQKVITNETIETNFDKINGVYFLSNSEIEMTGNLYDKDKISFSLSMSIYSNWSKFNAQNPFKIAFKDEENLFENIKFNESFWKKYDLEK